MGDARRERDMRFGERVRDLRTSKGLSQRALGKQIGVSFTYVSKIENEKLDFGDYPSELLICRIAEVLESDRDELLLLAKKIPEPIRRRVFERPDAFRRLAALDDRDLDAVMRHIARKKQNV
jgi:HTH-type transcriptional regulator, competence development regulator